MTYVVTDKCINCRYTDCIEVCPVDCFYLGENTVVIHPEQCIDCGVCEPECPAKAIEPDTNEGMEKWVEFNRKYAELWPNVTQKQTQPADADNWLSVEGKLEKNFSPYPGTLEE